MDSPISMSILLPLQWLAVLDGHTFQIWMWMSSFHGRCQIWAAKPTRQLIKYSLLSADWPLRMAHVMQIVILMPQCCETEVLSDEEVNSCYRHIMQSCAAHDLDKCFQDAVEHPVCGSYLFGQPNHCLTWAFDSLACHLQACILFGIADALHRTMQQASQCVECAYLQAQKRLPKSPLTCT